MSEVDLSISHEETRSYEEKIRDLEREIQELKENSFQIPNLLFEFTRRTLLSSISIRTAVSSMLSKNFLWDCSSDQEFLEIIDDSSDYVCNQLSLVLLLLRIQSNKVEIRTERYSIEEVLSNLSETLNNKLKKNDIHFDLSESISLINADFNYLITGLSLLLDAINDISSNITVSGSENPLSYELKIQNCSQYVYEVVNSLITNGSLPNTDTTDNLPNSNLKLLVSTKLLGLQGVNVNTAFIDAASYSITVSLPIYSESSHR